MKRLHIFTPLRFILIPNIAWASEGARQRLADPLLDNHNTLSVGRRRDRLA